ncbi:barstar family protein [Streptomyces sp. 549]|uniref:barstar family protein n=1 Tax=Streptomyces sp. 549 TaxID=3049076 RepID=UPI0024C339E8|nr:barstar family protein [Streptomyces sp. 549]MDK1474291.1 barstar family protein [Streptomyces sp. 549]
MTEPPLPLPDADLEGLLDGSLPPGLYRWHLSQSAAGLPDLTDPAVTAASPGRRVAQAELAGTRDRDAFFDRCSRALDLPDWFGRNWDAFADCLTDLSWWGEADGYLLVLRSWGDFQRAAPADAATAADVLSAAVAYWSARDTPMTVLLA